jgi:carbonic anhydrase
MSAKGMVVRIAALIAGLAMSFGVAMAYEASGVSPDVALKKLMDGNNEYVGQKMSLQKRSTPGVRESLAKSQKPYAVILSCSDSRVPPEVIFDKGLGEIFVVRVAGNIPDPIVLGSIEYAVEHLGTPLIMVLGHERCGAVTAAVDANGKAEGNIGAIVKTISPAVVQAKKEYKGKDKAQLVEAAINDNIRLVQASLTKNSPVIEHLVKEGKVKIVAAKYDLDDGKVTVIK